MDPLAQRRIGKVQGVGDGLEAVAFDDLAHGLSTAEDAGLLGLLEEGLQGGKGLLGKMKFEGPHSEGLQEKLPQKFIAAHALLILLSEQNLFDSNFSGAAYNPGKMVTYTGIDADAAAIAFAKKNLENMPGVQAQLYQRDCFQEGVPEGTADLIVVSHAAYFRFPRI
jgi:hypothetical protein